MNERGVRPSAAVTRFAQSAAGVLALDRVLERLVASLSDSVEADRASLFIYDEAKDELWSKIAQGLDSETIRFPADRGLAGACLRGGAIVNVPDAYADTRFNRAFDERTGYRTRSVLCVPIHGRDGRILGVIQVLNRRGGPFRPEDISLVAELGAHAAVFVENALLYERLAGLLDSFVEACSTAIDERDPTTSGHSYRVSLYAERAARAIHAETGGPFRNERYTRERLRQLRYAALLHDIGKIGVPEAVLTKHTRLDGSSWTTVEERYGRFAAERPAAAEELKAELEALRRLNDAGRISDEELALVEAAHENGRLTDAEREELSAKRGNLTDAEWAEMRSHVERGVRILRKIRWSGELDGVPDLAGLHHEKLSGRGYPAGIEAESLPLDARILAVVDIYEALTAQDRPYRRAMPHEKAAAILRDGAGKGDLDPDVVEVFLRTVNGPEG